MSLDDLLRLAPAFEPVFVVDNTPPTPRGRAEKGSPFLWSPSQVATYTDCPRKWFYSSVLRYPRAPSPSAELGTRVHALREAWLRDGTMPQGDGVEASLARTGLEHLPMPGTCSSIEEPFALDTQYGTVRGLKDFFLVDQGAVGYAPRERDWYPVDGIPLVGDHKTSAGERWAKTAEDLVGGDPQAVIYAREALEHAPEAPAVDLLWSYMIKGSRPKAHPVRARMGRDAILSKFDNVLDTAKKMLSIFDDHALEAEDVEPKLSACDAYGGCPFRDFCPRTNEQKMGAIMSLGSLEEQLRAMSGKLDTTTLPGSPKPQVPAPAPAQASAPPAGLAGLAGLAAAMAPATPVMPSVPPPAAPAPAATVAPVAPAVPAAAQTITPADAPAVDLSGLEEPPKRGRPKGAKAKSKVSPDAVLAACRIDLSQAALADADYARKVAQFVQELSQLLEDM